MSDLRHVDSAEMQGLWRAIGNVEGEIDALERRIESLEVQHIAIAAMSFICGALCALSTFAVFVWGQ